MAFFASALLFSSRATALVVALTLGGLGTLPARAAEALDTRLHEQVLMVSVGSWWSGATLQVTFFHPPGAGPFPLAVINHGKAPGSPREAPRNRSIYATRYFLSRGYAVALPMLRGFAGSGGNSWIEGCDAAQEGLEQARDIADVIQALGRRADLGARLDPGRVVVVGQSLGGWYTLAVGALRPPGVRGLVNFAGARNSSRCADWPDELARDAGRLGARTRVPSLWIYGDNDQVIPPPVWHAMFAGYTAAGAPAQLVDVGRFMNDSHALLGRVEGLPLWAPPMDAFLQGLGLPSRVLHPEMLPPAYPAPTHYADVGDVKAVPLVDDQGRDGYRRFLHEAMPRVFLIADNGSFISTSGGEDPLGRAQAACRRYALHCRPYAVDDQVVWPAER
jgi:dienelactone hydrolase